MGLEHLKSIPLLNDVYFKIWLKDAASKINRIFTHLGQEDKILDIGCGPGSVSLLLKEEGYDVTALDIKDLTYTDRINPVLYNWRTIPFADKQFDISLLLRVLHHVSDPINLLKEAARVSKKIIIIEDVYNSTIQQCLTYIVDSLVNFEISGHPHTNNTDIQWRDQFDKHGLKLSTASVDNYIYLFRQAVYVLNT